MTVVGTATRLSRVARRDQLLDVACALVVAQGPASVTIERLAAEAGVSRALAYQHFDNAEEVLIAVYRREVAELGERILLAVDATDTPDAKIRAAIRTFLDVVGARHGLFTVLAAAGSPVPAAADDGLRAGQRFAERLFADIFGLAPARARIAAVMTFGALNGGVEAWSAGEVRRADVEAAAVDVALCLAGQAAS